MRIFLYVAFCLTGNPIAQALHFAGAFCPAQLACLSQKRCQVSESRASLLLEAVEGTLMSPKNGPESVFSVSHEQLLLLCRCEQSPVPFAEGSD